MYPILRPHAMANPRIRELPKGPSFHHIPAMPARPYRSAIALGAWWGVSLLVGSWLAHGFFNGGKALADITTHKSINAPVDLVARWCRTATFSDFHRYTILATAALGGLLSARAWCAPDGPLRIELRMLRRDKSAVTSTLFPLLACVFFAIAITTLFRGWNAWTWPRDWMFRLLVGFLSAALIELTFRGVCWRAFSAVIPMKAAGLLVCVFHVLTMLVLDPPGIRSWEPSLSSERFPLLRAVTSGFMDSMVFFKYMVPLSLLAISLWAARLKTKSLWLLIGTQAGFLFASGISDGSNPPAMAALLTIMVFCGLPFTRSPREP